MQSIAIAQTNIADSAPHSSHSGTAFDEARSALPSFASDLNDAKQEQSQRHVNRSQEQAKAPANASSKSHVTDNLPRHLSSESSSQPSAMSAHSEPEAQTNNASFDSALSPKEVANDEAPNDSQDFLQFLRDADNLVPESKAEIPSRTLSTDDTDAAEFVFIDKGQVETQLNLAEADAFAELQAKSVLNAELDALTHVKHNGIGELPKQPIAANTESLQGTNNHVELVPSASGEADSAAFQQDILNQFSSSLSAVSATPASSAANTKSLGAIPDIAHGIAAETVATVQLSKQAVSEQHALNIDAEQPMDIRLNMSLLLTAGGQTGEGNNQSTPTQQSSKVAPLITDHSIDAEVEAVLEQANQALLQSSAIESGKEKVIPNLTAQLLSAAEENKAQIKAGKTPSVNLQDMAKEILTEAGVKPQTIESTLMSNTANTANTSTESTPSVFSMSNLSVSNNALNPINVSADQMQVNLEQRQAQVEQASQLKEQPSLSQLDKTINMSKPESASQLAEKVRFMVQNRQMVADVKLEPAELGAMQIRISMQGDTAAVSFVVQNAQARDAVAQGNETLRSLLQDSGLSLGDTDVQQESSQFGQSADSSDNGAGNGSPQNLTAQQTLFDEREQTGNIIAEHAIHSGNIGGIDFYA